MNRPGIKKSLLDTLLEAPWGTNWIPKNPRKSGARNPSSCFSKCTPTPARPRPTRTLSGLGRERAVPHLTSLHSVGHSLLQGCTAGGTVRVGAATFVAAPLLAKALLPLCPPLSSCRTSRRRSPRPLRRPCRGLTSQTTLVCAVALGAASSRLIPLLGRTAELRAGGPKLASSRPQSPLGGGAGSPSGRRGQRAAGLGASSCARLRLCPRGTWQLRPWLPAASYYSTAAECPVARSRASPGASHCGALPPGAAPAPATPPRALTRPARGSAHTRTHQCGSAEGIPHPWEQLGRGIRCQGASFSWKDAWGREDVQRLGRGW